MKDNKSASLFQKEQVMESLKQSFVKLNPRVMIKNPIMFTVEVVTVVMLIVCFLSLGTSEYGAFGYNLLVFIILFVTLLFANFAEAIAEARGKAQADSLRKTREETPAKVLVDGKIHTVSSSRLKKGDYFRFFVKFGGNLFFISPVFFFLNPIKSCRYVCFLVTLKTPHH